MGNIKINDSHYIRDAHSKAVLNTNRRALENYKIATKNKQIQIDDINRMKEDIAELKEMIKTLLGKQNG
jgi:hypothetical protein